MFPFQPISPVKRCGIITDYRVTVNSVGNDEAGKKKIIIVSPNKTSYGLSVDPNQITHIELTQKTRLGYPNNSDAGIYVFPENLRKWTFKLRKIIQYPRIIRHNGMLLFYLLGCNVICSVSE